MKIRGGIVLFFLFVCSFTFGQEYFSNTRKIGVEEGLSHYKILSFYSEENGMWIGTKDGLNFYDGFHWEYWTKEGGQLRNKSVDFILKDQQEYLWLFSTKKNDEKSDVLSIDVLTADRQRIYSFEEKFGEKAPFETTDIQHFFEDQQNRLYFFVNDQLWQYSPASLFTLVNLPEDFKPHTVFSDGTYIGKMNDRLVLVSEKGELLYTSAYVLNDNFYKVIGDSNQFWVWQNEAQCEVFERSTDSEYRMTLFPLQPEKGQDFDLMCYDEKRQQLWVSKGGMVFLCDAKSSLIYQHKVNQRRACLDNRGNLWTGKHELEILQLQKKKFKQYLHQDQDVVTINNLFKCRGIIEKNQKLYINTYKGLKLIDLTNGKLLPSPPGLGVNFAVIKDHQEQIWMGYKELFQLDDIDDRISKTFDHQQKNPRIWSLFEDREDRIWMGHIGLSYMEEDGSVKPFEKYNDFEELAEAIVLFFYKDKNGVIWTGTNKGLYQLDIEKGIIAAYGKNRKGAFQLPSSKFQHMYQDDEGTFWLVTEDAGLLRWDKATGDIQQYDKKYGMPSNNIYAVYEDDFGYLWLSSFKGLVRFKKTTKRITIYNEEDGISGNEFNRTSHHQATDGCIYFGGQNGVTAFHPKDFLEEKSDYQAFELAIKHTSVFGLKAWKDTLVDGSKIDLMKLNPGVRVLDLEIAVSDLFWTDKIDLYYTLQPIGQYRKALPAYKEKISSDNHIELFGMHPGHYNLQIKAVQKSGKQLGEPIQVQMRISKPIFHKPIFWVFVLLALGVTIWAYIKLKTTRLHKRQAELEILVTERTEQIFKDRKVIQNQAEQIEEMKGQLNRKDEVWLEQFQSIINERLEDPDLYLPDVIDQMDISRSVFYERVKTLTNMTPNQYIQELRLTKAKIILDQGKVKTVKEVAFAIGMKRPSYFSKLFKEKFGVLPSAYFRDHVN